MIGWRRARFVGSVLVSGALLFGCGSAHSDHPALGGSGASGAAGSAASSGSGVAGNASAGRGGSMARAGAGGTDTAHAGSSGSSPAAGAGATGGNVPVDTRPPRPTWDPPFTVGDPGWRDSTEPLCEKHVGDQEAFDVWADSRGVYGLFATTCNVLAGTSCGKQGVSLQFNDGKGWQLVYALLPSSGMGSNGDLRLAGFDSGALLLSGFLPDQVGIWRVTPDGTVALDASLDVGRPVTVGANLAYAFDSEKLYRFGGDAWAEYLPLPAPSQSLWADKDRLVLVGVSQAVFQKTADEDFAAIPGAPAGDYSAVWSFGANDTWVGNQAGQLLHFDGSKWTVFETGSKDVSGAGIQQLWGSSDGQLFFRTYTEFGRFDGKKVELLLELPADGDPSFARVTTGGMWGLSSDEVFIAVSDRQFNKYACGGQFMLFFDGKTLHAF